MMDPGTLITAGNLHALFKEIYNAYKEKKHTDRMIGILFRTLDRLGLILERLLQKPCKPLSNKILSETHTCLLELKDFLEHYFSQNGFQKYIWERRDNIGKVFAFITDLSLLMGSLTPNLLVDHNEEVRTEFKEMRNEINGVKELLILLKEEVSVRCEEELKEEKKSADEEKNGKIGELEELLLNHRMLIRRTELHYNEPKEKLGVGLVKCI